MNQPLLPAVTLPRITEAQFQRMVLELAKLWGWRTSHFRPGLTKSGRWRTAVAGDGVGVPDLILLRRGELIVAELKVGRNKPTPEQEGWLADWRLVPGAKVFVWYPRDWALIEEVLT